MLGDFGCTVHDSAGFVCLNAWTNGVTEETLCRRSHAWRYGDGFLINFVSPVSLGSTFRLLSRPRILSRERRSCRYSGKQRRYLSFGLCTGTHSWVV